MEKNRFKCHTPHTSSKKIYWNRAVFNCFACAFAINAPKKISMLSTGNRSSSLQHTAQQSNTRRFSLARSKYFKIVIFKILLRNFCFHLLKTVLYLLAKFVCTLKCVRARIFSQSNFKKIEIRKMNAKQLSA